MKARRLGALAALTDARSRRERRRLAEVSESHRTLVRQRRELGAHLTRYEREPVEDGREMPAPLLLQRQRFVALLAERIVALGEESRLSEARVREASSTCRTAMAQDIALGALHRRVEADESRRAVDAERRRTDDAVRTRGRTPWRSGATPSPFATATEGENS